MPYFSSSGFLLTGNKTCNLSFYSCSFMLQLWISYKFFIMKVITMCYFQANAAQVCGGKKAPRSQPFMLWTWSYWCWEQDVVVDLWTVISIYFLWFWQFRSSVLCNMSEAKKIINHHSKYMTYNNWLSNGSHKALTSAFVWKNPLPHSHDRFQGLFYPNPPFQPLSVYHVMAIGSYAIKMNLSGKKQSMFIELNLKGSWYH